MPYLKSQLRAIKYLWWRLKWYIKKRRHDCKTNKYCNHV